MSSDRLLADPRLHDRGAEDAWRDVAAALLAGTPPHAPDEIDVAAFLAAAAAHGVAGLLYGRVCANGLAARLPADLVAELRAGAHRQAAAELVQRAELQRLVSALHDRGVHLLLMKGASLAYDVYADPSWRVRSDVDMLIRDADRPAVRDGLVRLGYACADEVSGGLVAYQFHAERIDGRGLRHLCDVHWKIANPQRFAAAIAFDELAGAAIALPAIGPHARGLGRVHALWLACVHRAAHHYDRDTLAWLYDVHLLAEGLDAGGVDRFIALAERTGVRRICQRALDLTHARFNTTAAPALAARLGDGAGPEPSALFLRPGLRPVDILIDDLRALPTWRQRARLVKEVLFPDSTYMRRAYAGSASTPLAWLYLRRIARGASRWVRRSASATGQR